MQRLPAQAISSSLSGPRIKEALYSSKKASSFNFFRNGISKKFDLSLRNFSAIKSSRFFPTTIFALSTSPGKAGIAIIRVSGTASTLIIDQMTKSLNGKQSRIKPRTTCLRKIHEYGNETNLIDVGIVTLFNAPYSYTGEDMVELHVHGGNSIVKAVLNSIGKIPSCVLAKPGEFSERAFYNNKLDLTEIEGLADLINAETEYQRKQALSQAQGSNKQVFMGWRSSIIDAMANIETMIDFSEEESIDADLFANGSHYTPPPLFLLPPNLF
ncbi:tRNA modification GTPase MnmE [Smittium culicis]|uniref:tRNA modification GTPase MnmE n=1 Tax=Smittium culicis TaxID=133412 RepID=A0A1R1YTR7_9FUNG|nr:tRNA modification GTPase MnmE [Smittium culicis]